MKAYQYQILRYIPDQVSGEFLNVGIVLFSPSERKLRYEFVNSSQRISAAFHGIEYSHIIKKIKIFQKELESFERKKVEKLKLEDISSVTYYSRFILKKDDSALQFSNVKNGMDISIESAFMDLKNRLLYKWIIDNDNYYRSDDDVWRERYKKHFEQAGLTNQLVHRTVKTRTDTLKFAQAYKNGVWNYFQPINLNLKKTDSIKNKVYKWKGIMSEMQTADEDLKLVFLSEMPEKQNRISEFIKEQLDSKDENKVSSELITPDHIDRLLEKLLA